MMQLAPSLVWNAIYAKYLQDNPKSTIVEDILKDSVARNHKGD